MATELLFRDDAYLRTATARVLAVHERGIEFDRTFYPQGGGQAGDTGALVRANGESILIGNTLKGDTAEGVLHVPLSPMPNLEIGETLQLEIDWERRYQLMRLHTALHVMSCVVVAPVTGGNIAPDKARLDFDIDMNLLDAGKIEHEMNALIARGAETETVWITDEELDARPELIKTMSVKPPRGAGTFAQDSWHRSATLRRDTRAEHRRDRRHPRSQNPQRGKTQQAGGNRARGLN